MFPASNHILPFFFCSADIVVLEASRGATPYRLSREGLLSGVVQVLGILN